jgi:phosphoenolpyruvate-protein phosphotransferase/dihydroxyacetone kinase phosphotransfer subunit
MVGIVIVSHSARIAEGIAELAREMGGRGVRVEAAGGLDEPGNPLGTDAARVAGAIGRADGGDGVVVLMDLGSAVLSAEMALELLDAPTRVALSGAPVVEGAIAAAAAARAGAPLADVVEEARRGLDMKAGHLGEAEGAPAAETGSQDRGSAREVRLEVTNPLGLHARPAARFVQTAARFDADIEVSNESNGRGPARGRSLSGVATLGVRQGDAIRVRARGREATEALEALRDLAEEGFGDDDVAPAPPGRAGGPGAPSATGALSGVAASPGIGIGPAQRWPPLEPQVDEGPAGAPEEEWAALQAALQAAGADLERGRAELRARAGDAAAAILAAQALLLEDDALLEPTKRAIHERGSSAAAAWREATEELRAAYESLEDDYQRARAADVAEVARAVQVVLASGGAARPRLDSPAVVVARELGPRDAAGLDPDVALGVVTARGGPTSHGAIVARAAGIPAVVGVGEAALAIPPGTTVAVDGDGGEVHVDPGDEALAQLRARREQALEERRAALAAASEPALTRDGVRVDVMANAATPAEARAARRSGADGIGLLRTEFLFLGRDQSPSEEDQCASYGDIAAALEGRGVIVRTLDAGADKPLAYLDQPLEDNPFLGVRGVRLSLACRELLRTQLRALLRAAARHPLKVMFPMVATLAELRAARAELVAAAESLAEDDVEHADSIEVGVMVEVPSMALAAARFAREVDFFSIGTNDLCQYTMAAERGNERLAGLNDPLDPSVLRLVAMACEGAAASGVPVGVCGEAAADPVAVVILVGLGVTELSVAPVAIPRVKETVRAIDRGAARALARAALAAPDASAVRALASRAPNEGWPA